MVLSQRERYVAVGLGLVLVLLVLWEVVYNPLTDWSNAIADAKLKANNQASSDNKLFADEKRLLKVWDEIQKGGLKSDPSEAQNQLRQAVAEWAAQSGVGVSNGKSDTPSAVPGDNKAGFVQAGYQVTCTGTTSGIAKLLYQIEVAKIPARIHSMQISSRKEGVDDLQVVLTLTTLCVVKPEVSAPVAAPPVSTASRTDEQ